MRLHKQVEKPRLTPLWESVSIILTAFTAAVGFNLVIFGAVTLVESSMSQPEAVAPRLDLDYAPTVKTYWPSTNYVFLGLSNGQDVFSVDTTGVTTVSGKLMVNDLDVGASIEKLQKKCR